MNWLSFIGYCHVVSVAVGLVGFFAASFSLVAGCSTREIQKIQPKRSKYPTLRPHSIDPISFHVSGVSFLSKNLELEWMN